MGGRIDGHVAVITGGSSGIGAATAARFVAEGARVVVADVQEALGRDIATQLGEDAAAFAPCDVTDEAAVAAAVNLAVDRWGRLDCMFNNAGIVGAIGPIAETDAADWDRTLAVLLRSVFLGTKHAARVMVPQGSGTIINTSSAAGIQGGLGPHAYTAAKAAVVGLTKSASAELVHHGIRVNAIAPGKVLTALTAEVETGDHTDFETAGRQIGEGNPLGFTPVADDIAAAVLYLASDEARFVTGHTLVVDGGRTVNGGSRRFATAASGVMASGNQPVS